METIVIINDYAFINGGAEKVAILSAIELARKGKRVLFFSSVGPICKELKDSLVEVICLEQEDILKGNNRIKAIIKGLWNYSAQKELKKILDNLNPSSTIVHIHSWQKSLTSSVIYVANKMNFKIVLTLHNYSITCPNGGFYNFKKQEVCKVQPLSPKCIYINCDSRKYMHKIWRICRQIIESKIVKLDKIIPNYIYISEKSKSIISANINEKANYYYVSNPTTIISSKRIEVEKNHLYAFIGRLNAEKGVLCFAKATNEIKCEAIIIGDGEYKSKILDIDEDIKITGWKNQDEINQILSKVRCLVLPSLWYEGMPLVVLEAMSKGIPIIVSDVCNATELVLDNYNGLHFETNNYKDLIIKIKKTMSDNVLVEKMSKNSFYSFWKKPYNIQRHISELEEVYRKILKE